MDTLCRFEVGDIRKRIEELDKFDVIILGYRLYFRRLLHIPEKVVETFDLGRNYHHRRRNDKYLFTGDIASLKNRKIASIPAFFDTDTEQV